MATTPLATVGGGAAPAPGAPSSASGGGSSAAAHSLDAIAAIRYYVDRMVSSVEGMKVLLLDEETTQIVSTVYSQTTILEREVYLVERLDAPNANHEPMMHLRAVCFLRPTEANAALLAKELASPKYAEYHLFFSNLVPPPLLRAVAEADELDSVRQVQEFYGDFMAINPELFSLQLPQPLLLSAARQDNSTAALAAAALQRSVAGVLSALLSFKRRPSQIRYQAASPAARQVAAAVAQAIQADQIFDFRRPGPGQEGPTLLLLDRRDDPVTPLLSQWTYQAMVHELLGIDKNRVSLAGAPGIAQQPELKEVVLSCTQDDFFARNRNANFGDLGVAVKGLLDDYQRQAKLNENIQSIEDMQRFLERFPTFRSHALNVSKHVAIMSELARLVELEGLLDLSQFEQELACDDEHALHFKTLCERIADPKVKPGSKLRLAMLYALRYEERPEQQGNLQTVKTALARFGVSPDNVALLDALLAYAGASKRAPGLFGSMTDRLKQKMQMTLQGVNNVYTRHKPALLDAVEQARKGKLKETAFPGVNGAVLPPNKATDVIVFVVGGATYEEATRIAEMNAAAPPGAPRVVLGASTLHNSASFLEEIRRHYLAAAPSPPQAPGSARGGGRGRGPGSVEMGPV